MTTTGANDASPGGDEPESSRTTTRRLLDLALPMVGINVLAVLTLAVDTIMCARLEDSENVLAALGFATQIIFFLMIAIMGLTVGTVALVARAFGAQDLARVNHVVGQSTVLTVLLSVAVGIGGNLVAGPLLSALGASDEVVAIGLDYLRPLLAGTVSYYLMLLYSGVLRGVGNTRLPFQVALLTNVINVVLDYGLILGELGMPALGVRGAAIGTIIAYSVNVGITVLVLRRGAIAGLRARIWPIIRGRSIDKALAKVLFRIGAPAALDMLILNVGFLAIIGMLGRIDEVAVAAHGVGLRIQALAFVPGLGIAQATGALVGQALGASNVWRARATVRASVFLCALVMSTLGFLFIAAAYPIVGIFDVQPGTQLETYAIEWMRLLGYSMPPVGVHIAFVGMLQGAGATNTSLHINVLGTFLVQLPLGYVLGFPLGMGPFGIWLSFPISISVKAGLAWLAYRRGRWARVGADT